MANFETLYKSLVGPYFLSLNVDDHSMSRGPKIPFLLISEREDNPGRSLLIFEDGTSEWVLKGWGRPKWAEAAEALRDVLVKGMNNV